MSGTITVHTFGEPSRAAAERDLRKQLKDYASERGLRLVGRPNIDVEQKMVQWYNGSATQDFR